MDYKLLSIAAIAGLNLAAAGCDQGTSSTARDYVTAKALAIADRDAALMQAEHHG